MQMHQQCWGGFSAVAFQKWGQYLWLALPCEPLFLMHAGADLTGVHVCLWDEAAGSSVQPSAKLLGMLCSCKPMGTWVERLSSVHK